MARLKGDSINVSIFMALKVSEKANVPCLLMSNPGVGKTTTVEMYAQLRNMKVVVLRGNSSSPEEIMGYETCPTDVTKDGGTKSSQHLRPSWFERVLDNHEKGIKTILFLDELTTANEFVQAALLELIFGRKVGEELLPPVEDCLIVAAGNYMANLSASMTVLSPVLNRFMIFNITPEESDLDTFLCKFDGAIGNSGKPTNHFENIRKNLEALDSQEISMTESSYNIAGEYFEKAVKDTTRMLIKGNKIDLSVAELQTIYSDAESNGDSNLYGFPTFRTLGYLRDVALACYQCFGKSGISSDNFKTMIAGLAGVGLTKGGKSKNYDVVKTPIYLDYYNAIIDAAQEVVKIDNDVLGEYTKFFSDILDAAKSNGNKFSEPDIIAINNKLGDIKKDVKLKDIDKPISVAHLEGICTCAVKGLESTCALNFGSGDIDYDSISAEDFGKYVTFWNNTAEMMMKLKQGVNSKANNYEDSIKVIIDEQIKKAQITGFKLHTLKKAMTSSKNVIAKTLPDVVTLK